MFKSPFAEAHKKTCKSQGTQKDFKTFYGGYKFLF